MRCWRRRGINVRTRSLNIYPSSFPPSFPVLRSSKSSLTFLLNAFKLWQVRRPHTLSHAPINIVSFSDASESRYGYEPTRSVCIIFVVIFSITTRTSSTGSCRPLRVLMERPGKLVAHTWQATRSRAWWLIPTVVIAALAEVLGWTARVMSSYDALNRTTYILQYVLRCASTSARITNNLSLSLSFACDDRATVLVLAPTPFVAALFMGFGRVATRLGSEYSRLSPTMCELSVCASSQCTLSPMIRVLIPPITLDSRVFLTIDIVSLFVQGAGGGMAASGNDDADKVKLVSCHSSHLHNIH